MPLVISFCFFAILWALPAAAHDHSVVHHWNDVRYISELHIQLVFLALAGIALTGYMYAKKLRRNR